MNLKLFSMPYDLQPIARLLEDTNPQEIALLLDEALYDMVVSVVANGDYETLPQRYSNVLTLRNHFAMMDEKLSSIWK